MTRKDSEKDAERPHYYSQFWLDIAAGRRVIGGPKPEEAEANEVEAPELMPARKAGRSAADTLKETRTSAVAEPEVEEEEEEEELELENMVEEAEIPTILIDEESELADEDFNEEEAEPEEDEFFEEEEEEEEEDEEEWGRRGGARKKAKPARPTKPVKKPKREPRRNF